MSETRLACIALYKDLFTPLASDREVGILGRFWADNKETALGTRR